MNLMPVRLGDWKNRNNLTKQSMTKQGDLTLPPARHAQLSTPILRRDLPFLDQAVRLDHPVSPRTPSGRLSNSSGFLSALFDAHFVSFVLAVLACSFRPPQQQGRFLAIFPPFN